MLKNFRLAAPFLLIGLLLIIANFLLLSPWTIKPGLNSTLTNKAISKSLGRFERDTLRMNLGCEPPSLDWAKATDAASFDVVSNIMNGLTTYTNDLSCTPACAQSWEILDNGKRYIFHLRPNLRWSDGKPLTAYDFQYAWRRLLDPQTAAPYAFFLYDI